MLVKYFFQSLYTRGRLFQVLWACSGLFVLAFFWPFLLLPAQVLAGGVALLFLVDLVLLYGRTSGDSLEAERLVPERFSNGDDNPVRLRLKSKLDYGVDFELYEEFPVQFQKRDFVLRGKLSPRGCFEYSYVLRPLERGDYRFGYVLVYISSSLGFFSRRHRLAAPAEVKVYPSFLQMRRYELMAISNRLSDVGVKKIRRLGHHNEFDQIRDYIQGDDVRTLNWKATARKGHLMVNQYQDEKAQQVYCVIDMGRTMRMPFGGMTLVDYAINTSLVLANIALLRHDKAGLLTFDHRLRSFLPARRQGRQMQALMELLYKQEPSYGEHNLEALYAQVRRQIPQRSLLVLFTSFESLESARRQFPLLSALAARHLLMVVFFENHEVQALQYAQAADTQGIYRQALAEKTAGDKRQLVKALEQRGIAAVLTSPEKLTVAAVNRYLEYKSRGLL